MNYLEEIDHTTVDFGDQFDELPLWSAPFGLRLLERVPLGPDLRIVDLGAGTGFLSIELAERCGPRARVYAVDPWASALARLERKAQRRGVENIVVCPQDAASLDLPSGSIDLIVSNLGVNNFDDPAGVLRTCHRLTRPGGCLILTSNLRGTMAEFYAVFRETLEELGHHDRIDSLERHLEHRGSVTTVTGMLADAGFVVSEVDESVYRWRFADGSALLRHFFIRLGFLGGWKAIARPEDVSGTFDRLERRLNRVAAEHGELALTIPVVCVVAFRGPQISEP